MSQHLILGGARSGKSSFAERLLEQISVREKLKKVYLATATVGDNEMADRIQMHKQQRDEKWRLIEEPVELANIIENSKKDECLLIDCLTLWLSNCLYHECWDGQKDAFLNALKNCQTTVVMVSNEVGYGIVPMGELSRRFVDESGWLHQALAQQCSHVSVVVAGIENVLKKPN